MTTQQFLLTAWHPKPEVFAGCAALLAGYALLARPLSAPRALAFVSGVAVLLLSLVSPLDALAHEYLFSAHMAQHLLLTLVVPPLLLLGLPEAEGGRRKTEARRRDGRDKVASLCARLFCLPPSAFRLPFVAWWLATGVMWLWHLPPLYNAALASDTVHVVQHALLLATALLFWWPVLGPARARAALPAWAAILYLFLALAAGSVLGIILAFAPPGLYPRYLAPPDSHGLLALVRDGWGLTPADDQQLGGFLMWIPGGIAYSLALFVVLARWFGEPEDDPVAAGAVGADPPRSPADARPALSREQPVLALAARRRPDVE